jgi:hypothetical protein
MTQPSTAGTSRYAADRADDRGLRRRGRGDPEVAAAWAEYEQRRRQDTRALVGSLEPWLRPGLGVESATDIQWGLFSHAPADALMRHRGWSLDRDVDFALERLLLA